MDQPDEFHETDDISRLVGAYLARLLILQQAALGLDLLDLLPELLDAHVALGFSAAARNCAGGFYSDSATGWATEQP